MTPVLTAQVHPQPALSEFGLCLRGAGRFGEGHLLRFEPYREKVSWSSPSTPAVSALRRTDVEEQERSAIYQVNGLDRQFGLEIIALHDIIDVCVDGRRTLVNRVADLPGDQLSLCCLNGQVAFAAVEVRPL